MKIQNSSGRKSSSSINDPNHHHCNTFMMYSTQIANQVFYLLTSIHSNTHTHIHTQSYGPYRTFTNVNGLTMDQLIRRKKTVKLQIHSLGHYVNVFAIVLVVWFTCHGLRSPWRHFWYSSLFPIAEPSGFSIYFHCQLYKLCLSLYVTPNCKRSNCILVRSLTYLWRSHLCTVTDPNEISGYVDCYRLI